MKAEEDIYYRNLCSIMYKTRGCRFSAADALRTKNKWSISTVTFLTVYLLSLSIFSMSYPEIITEDRARFVNVFSAISSVSLLVLALMDFAFDRGVQAEKLHLNALHISLIMRALERELETSNPDIDRIKELASDYEREISETGINHKQVDITRWEFSRAKSDNVFVAFGYLVRKRLYDGWYYISTMFIYPTLFISIVVPTAIYFHFVIWPHLLLK